MVAACIGNTEILSRGEQIRYIRRYIDTISVQDRHTIGKLFYNEKPGAIQEHPEGCAFDLANFSNGTIMHAFQLISQILDMPAGVNARV